jgi:hypothetical protein
MRDTTSMTSDCPAAGLDAGVLLAMRPCLPNDQEIELQQRVVSASAFCSRINRGSAFCWVQAKVVRRFKLIFQHFDTTKPDFLILKSNTDICEILFQS